MIFKGLERLFMIQKYGSFSKAADELYISRSALTQQIKSLEKELGFQIFERDYKGTNLTSEGQYFLTETEKINTKYEDILHYCRTSQNRVSDTIVIGLMANLGSSFLPHICREFNQKYPYVKFKFRDYFPSNYVMKFYTKDFDVSAEYFYNYIHDIKDLEVIKIASTAYSVQVLPGSSLTEKKELSFTDLRGKKLLMYRRGIAKGEDDLRNYLLEYEPEITIMDIDSYDSSLYMKCELEDAVLLSYSLYEHCFPQFVSLPLLWDRPIHLGLCYHKDCKPIVRTFIEFTGTLYNKNGGNHIEGKN